MSNTGLTQRLDRLRGTIRRRLFGYGICAVLAGGVVAFLTIVALDWALNLPSVPRIVAGVVFVIGFLGACLYWIIRPMRLRLGRDEIAARLELHFGSLNDRLSSTVHFLERTPNESEDRVSSRLEQQVIANTERLIADMSFRSALSFRPLAVRALALAVSMAALGATVLISPGWARTGLYRYIHPLGEIEWPRRVAILPLTADQTVAVGESVKVRMRIQRGLTPSLRGVVHLREAGGQTVSLALQREPSDQENGSSDTFYAVVDAVASDLTYWFSAGDADTSRSPSSLRVVRRPQIVETIATVEPPAYAPTAPSRVHDPNDGPIRVPSGGFVSISVTSSKTIAEGDAREGSGLRTDSAGFIPLTADPSDWRRLSCRFQVNGDLNFRIELLDTDGFENRGSPEFTVLAQPDLPPTVTILEPRAMEELTPRGSIESVVHAEDDYGIEEFYLDVSSPRKETASRIELSDKTDARKSAGDDASDRGNVGLVAHHTWRLEDADLGTLVPGDIINYTAVARDNRVTDESAGQIGRSQVMRVRIISQTEFDMRVRTDLAALETRVRQALLDQNAILDTTTTLHVTEPSNTALTEQQRQTAGSLATAQARMARRIRDLSARFSRLSKRVGRNHTGADSNQARIANLGAELQAVASVPMTEASSALHNAAESGDPAAQQMATRDASALQSEAIDQLERVLRTMSRLGSFQELFSKTRSLLDRQEEVRRETGDTGQALLGKRIDALSKTESAALKRTERKQEQLLKDAEQLLATMTRQADAARTKDETISDALDATVRAARAHDATRHMKEAAEGLAENRTAAAGIAQQAATKALRKMLAALNDRETRRLEELRKQIARAEDLVADLIVDQRAQRDATHEAGLMNVGERVFRDQAQAQRRLQQNAKLLGDKLMDDDRMAQGSTGTGPAARLVQRASVSMGNAESELNGFRAVGATVAQDEALRLLHESLFSLQQLALQAEDQILRRSLTQIREHLEDTLTAQRDVNDGIFELRKAVAAKGRITRKEAREASKLARAQAETRAMIDEHRDDFKQVVVYHWALRRVTDWMEESRRGLSERDLGERLTFITDRIVSELKQLLQALADTESLPVDSSFVETEDAGGQGGGQSMPPKAIPRVAELLVLKSMQARVNAQTAKLSAGLSGRDRTEEQLRMLRTLGEDQVQIQQLAKMLTEQAQHP